MYSGFCASSTDDWDRPFFLRNLSGSWETTGMTISYGMTLLSISTQAWSPTTCSIPTNGLRERSRISSTSPSFLWRSVFSFRTATLTVSPFRAPLVLEAFTNMSSSSPSTITNAYPSLVIWTLPVNSGYTFFSFFLL